MWLIQEDVAREMQRIEAAGLQLTDAQRAEYEKLCAESREAAAQRITARDGSVAKISVEGMLTERPSIMAMLLGVRNTSYSSIQEALARADADPEIVAAAFDVNSPGGHVDGLFQTIDAIKAFSKPITVRADNAQSAAYALAAAAGPISAKSSTSTFGSIGVTASVLKTDSIVEITNTASPKKRPDVKTEEGRKVVQEQLDAVHNLFVGEIADGRSFHGTKAITGEHVSAKFGKGATLLASAALDLGMIDSVPDRVQRKRATQGARAEHAVHIDASEAIRGLAEAFTGYEALLGIAHQNRARVGDLVAVPITNQPLIAGPVGAPLKRKSPMNKEELKAQHPELYAAVLAEGKEAGAAAALVEERDRVEAHLTAGEETGDVKTAYEAIRKGTPMTQSLMTKYMMAGMNRNAVSARQVDSDAAGKVLDGAAPVKPAQNGAAQSLLDLFASDLPPSQPAA